MNRTRLARTCAALAMGYATDLLLAESEAVSLPDRQFHMARACTAWAALCRHQAMLEPMIPKSTEAGYDTHAMALEIQQRAERKAAA